LNFIDNSRFKRLDKRQ